MPRAFAALPLFSHTNILYIFYYGASKGVHAHTFRQRTFTRRMTGELTVSAPGRICLFGEHQDYLNLPVVAAAVSLRLTIGGTRREDDWCVIALPDVQAVERFPINSPLPYTHQKDYFRSAAVVLQRHGFTFSHGVECTVRSAIPIKSGTSSSSALAVAWVKFLVHMSDRQSRLSSNELAHYAYETEVVEFAEAGGIMDQCAAAFGGVLAIDFVPAFDVEQLHVELMPFVLGDSREPKDTQAILSRVKYGVLEIVRKLRSLHPEFSLHQVRREEIDRYKRELTAEQFTLLDGTLRNFALTQEARTVLRQSPLDHSKIGELLNEHHRVLRDVQRISTPKIERMLDAALQAGAYGGKINGSGGGGCMFAYAPERTEQVAEAIERAGGTAYVVHVDEGAKTETGKGRL